MVRSTAMTIMLVVVLASSGGLGAVRIATANLNRFGCGGTDCRDARLSELARILCQYDVVACQEVMRASEGGRKCYGCAGATCQVDKLLQLMDVASGVEWLCRLSSVFRYGTRYEHCAILYNSSVVTGTGREGTVNEIPDSPVFDVRPPFWASYRAG